jgi:hypothetical protein
MVALPARVRKTDDRVARVFLGRAAAGVSLAGLCIVPYARRILLATLQRPQETFALWRAILASSDYVRDLRGRSD